MSLLGISTTWTRTGTRARAAAVANLARQNRIIAVAVTVTRRSHWRTLGTAAVAPVRTLPCSFSTVDVDEFRREAFLLDRPLLLRQLPGLPGVATTLPAAAKWFVDGGGAAGAGPSLNLGYLGQFADEWLEYELTYRAGSDDLARLSGLADWIRSGIADAATAAAHLAAVLDAAIADASTALTADGHPSYPLAGVPEERGPAAGTETRFGRFGAPLGLILRAHEYNRRRAGAAPASGLYIAQHPISDLPAGLRADLPTPRLVREARRGDVYGASLWLGLQPTDTPLHRDPNPNLLVQMRGSKTVRLLGPTEGEALYALCRAPVGCGAGGGGRGRRGRIRGVEMMEGPEREALAEAVWGPRAAAAAVADWVVEVVEAEVRAGDALFVPLGWWHAVRSGGDRESGGEGRDEGGAEGEGERGRGWINASANWWFR